jgi:hypothetical protein
LKPGGEFHILDFGPPHHLWARLLAPFMKRFEEADDNLAGRLTKMLTSAGFEAVEAPAHYGTLFGTLSLYRAVKPGSI